MGALNENYARELMELHTLGVDGGYTEADILEVARCITGWQIDHGDPMAQLSKAVGQGTDVGRHGAHVVGPYGTAHRDFQNV